MDVSCITLSGQHGTGTSSAGILLAKKLNFRFVSAGDLFRVSAKRRGIDIREFTRIVEGDPFLKDQLDEKLREESRRGQVVVEGRLAGWIARESAKLRVLLIAPLEVRVNRIAKRDNKSIEVANSETVQREKEAYEWFLKTYGIDITDKSIYNLVIDTTDCNIECVVDTILFNTKKIPFE